jgi:hypothetical protein
MNIKTSEDLTDNKLLSYGTSWIDLSLTPLSALFQLYHGDQF